MRLKFLIAFMATLLLAIVVPEEPASRFTQDQRIAAIVFSDACKISNYVCDSLTPPMVRRSASLGDGRARGAYWNGSTVIWLDEPVRGTQVWLTLFHETVHYIQYYNTVSTDGHDLLLRCIKEREAWTLTEQYIDVLHAPQTYRRSLEEWRRLYGCHDRRAPADKRLMHDANRRSK